MNRFLFLLTCYYFNKFITENFFYLKSLFYTAPLRIHYSQKLNRDGKQMSIINLLEQIKNDDIVLPSIQRDFVWSEVKMEKLLDSLMRGYPIGISLLWETYNDIQFRNFSRDYRSDTQHTFHINKQNKRLKIVLDGQQRLQSLYIALYGTYEGKYLYFDVLSGRENNDFKEDKFIFEFFTSEKAEILNNEADNSSQNFDSLNENGNKYYLRIKDLLEMGAKERQRLKQSISKKFNLTDEDILRLELNLSILRDSLSSDENILKVSVIDENKPRDSEDRKTESDVLEAFVRINQEGTNLSRSDLIFSMLKLNWKESAETLPEFVRTINKGNSFELDTDFVIRCLFAVSNLGTKFDINILRKTSNIEKVQNNFDVCCEAIRSTVDFVQTNCWIASSKLLKTYYNLVPLVYYLFYTTNHQVPDDEIDRVRKSIYLFGFTSPFSKYADSRLGKFIREDLKPLAEKGDEKFPLEESVYWVHQWAKIDNFGPRLLQGNPSLALHLIQRRSGAKVHYEKNAPQIDHIFPRSKLRDKKYKDAEIDHFSNYWILAKNKNQNKSNKHPKKYFEDVNDTELHRAFIDRELLDYRSYKIFIKNREAEIVEKIKEELKISDTDFNFYEHWDID